MNGRRRPIAGALLFFAASAIAACVDGGTASRGTAAVAVAPSFSPDAIESYERARLLGLTLDNVRLRLHRSGGERIRDTVVALALGQDSAVFEMTVRLNYSPELLKARLELRSGELVIFTGSADVIASAGGASDVPLIPMNYVGPRL